MSNINFVPCVHWVKKGAAKQIPETVKLTKEELKRVIEESRQRLGDADDLSDDQMETTENVDSDAAENDEALIQRYNLGDYDAGENEEENAALSLANITVFASNEDDPYLERESDDSEEDEDYKIKPTDNLVLAGHVEKDSVMLEVYVYNKDQEDLYIHHDILLEAYPICFEWLNFESPAENSNESPNQTANFIAIGDMKKDILIWDLDLVNSIEPSCKLIGHKDSVLALSWNRLLRKTMASGSADHSVILWDLETQKLINRFTYFDSNVQSLEFHPIEAQTLLTSDCSGNVSIGDCQSGAFKKWRLNSSEIEKVIWNQYNPYLCFASDSDGNVFCLDCRKENKTVYQVKTHSDSVTGLCFSFHCPGCLITASLDKLVKVWDVDASQAQFVHEFSQLNLGSILSLNSNPDAPFIIALGGDNPSNNFKVIDISSAKNVRTHFTTRVSL